MKKTTKAVVVDFGLFFVSMFVMTAGITAAWVTGEAGVFGLVVLAATVVATLLVLYFDWRAKLFDRTPDEAPYSVKTAWVS